MFSADLWTGNTRRSNPARAIACGKWRFMPEIGFEGWRSSVARLAHSVSPNPAPKTNHDGGVTECAGPVLTNSVDGLKP
jgi:hypothetical protein